MMWMGGDACVALSLPTHINEADSNKSVAPRSQCQRIVPDHDGRRKRPHPASAQPPPLQDAHDSFLKVHYQFNVGRLNHPATTPHSPSRTSPTSPTTVPSPSSLPRPHSPPSLFVPRRSCLVRRKERLR